MHLKNLHLTMLKHSLTVPTLQNLGTMYLSITAETPPVYNKQETKLTAMLLSQPLFHQLGIPIQQIILPQIHSNKVLSSPLNNINPRKKKKSAIKREKFGMHVPRINIAGPWRLEHSGKKITSHKFYQLLCK